MEWVVHFENSFESLLGAIQNSVQNFKSKFDVSYTL